MPRVEYTCICGRRLTQREAAAIRRKAKEAQKEAGQEKLKNYASRTSLFSDKIFTKSQAATLIEKGIIKPIEDNGKVYFLKSEVMKGLRYFNSVGLFYE